MRLRRTKNEHRLGQGLAAIGKGCRIISDSYETRRVISTRLPSNPPGPHMHPGGTGCAHQDSTACTSTTVTPTCWHAWHTIGRTWTPAPP